mmetsp:Transcript_5188/g.11268  ORF Transcript_5188/g.11268 Transcript_5188/m.11268 type:complete len:380 (-) Transcript_5188:481-1620(-)
MHAVCRKRQGIEWSPAEPQGIDQNMQHLVDVAVRPNPAPAPEDALTLAYGAGSAPKLVSQISGMSLILRKKSLAETLKMVRVPKELAELLHAGLVPALHVAASDDEGEVREAATLALSEVARHHSGRERMLEQDSVAVLSTQVCDRLAGVRSHGLRAMLELGKGPAGVAGLVEGGGVELLLRRVAEEEPQLQGMALMALTQAMSHHKGLEKAVEGGALEIIIPVLSSDDVVGREKAALSLAACTVNLKEKSKAAFLNGMMPLLQLLQDEELAVRKAAAQALMSLTVSNDCKVAAVELKAVKELIPVLEQSMKLKLQGTSPLLTAFQVNVLQCMAQIAEHPIGRKQLKAVLPQLATLADDADEHVRRHASIANDAITRMP